ncbi:MAG: PEP-CTERM sorting domain-containing protein [Planctomycetota bacterium]
MRHRRFVSLFIVTLMLCANAQAEVVMNVFASSAPNFTSSPSWSGYLSNALNSLENGLGNIGDRTTDPTAYEFFADGAVINPQELIVSNFSSWRGVADLGSPFDSERGNRLHFGMHVVGDGSMRFRLEDLSYEISSTDGNRLGFVGSFAGLTYSATRFGIDYGADMMKGGGDDTIIDSGSADQLVDELVYVGVGNGFDASVLSGTNQEKIDQLLSQIQSGGAFNVTGGYSLSDPSGGSILAAASSTITAIPEPTALAFLTVVAGSVGLRRRRRQ